MKKQIMEYVNKAEAYVEEHPRYAIIALIFLVALVVKDKNLVARCKELMAKE